VSPRHYQAPQAVALGEARNEALAMLVGAAADVRRDTRIEDAVRVVGHDVNPAAGHWSITAWMAGSSPARTVFGLDLAFERVTLGQRNWKKSLRMSNSSRADFSSN
jgi:hypothetical protein